MLDGRNGEFSVGELEYGLCVARDGACGSDEVLKPCIWRRDFEIAGYVWDLW